MTADHERRVTIVGGGLAGLAAAVALAEYGVPSVLLESRPRLGGRASSFHDAEADEWIDNCQHVSMGCCTNFRHFCRLTGIAGAFQREPALFFVAPSGRVHRFAASCLPAPLHLAGAFARLSYLSWRDKWALARGLRALARPLSPAVESLTIGEWLQQQRQPPGAVERFWKVVLVSALSESLDRISVSHARKVFVDGFLANRDGWTVEIPTVPLEELYGRILTDWLTARGVELRTLTAVERIDVADGRATAVHLRKGARQAVDELIVAVPHFRLLPLLPAELAAHPEVASVARLEGAPISSLHLWCDRPLTPLRHAVFVTGLVQWVFNRTAISGRPPQPGEPWYYQVVISASREVVASPSAAIRERVLQELAAVWPEAAAAEVRHARLVTEHRAVFSVTPGVDALRPAQQSPVPNLQFAGDWTRTGWPATMEGAVRSGFAAAENVLRRLGKPAAVRQPDLPVSWLSRRLLGL